MVKQDKKTFLIDYCRGSKIKNYVGTSFVFSLLFILLDVLARLFVKDYENLFVFNKLSDNFNVLLNLLIIFIGAFIISFCLEFFGEEKNMIRNKKCSRRV